jgi:hypothetical protein
MKGYLGFIGFIFFNVFLSIIITIYRKNVFQKFDFKSIFASALMTTLIFHVIAILDDIKSSQWIVITAPIAFFFGLLISGLSSIIIRVLLIKKRGR